jgi:hypothetical protein
VLSNRCLDAFAVNGELAGSLIGWLGRVGFVDSRVLEEPVPFVGERAS